MDYGAIIWAVFYWSMRANHLLDIVLCIPMMFFRPSPTPFNDNFLSLFITLLHFSFFFISRRSSISCNCLTILTYFEFTYHNMLFSFSLLVRPFKTHALDLFPTLHLYIMFGWFILDGVSFFKRIFLTTRLNDPLYCSFVVSVASDQLTEATSQVCTEILYTICKLSGQVDFQDGQRAPDVSEPFFNFRFYSTPSSSSLSW